MLIFLRAEIIREAVNRLVASKAQRGFTDFLILKRALVRAGGANVPFSMKDPNFTGAIHEVASSFPQSPAETSQAETEAPFFKVFGIAQAVSRKMVTNGSADTLSGPNWQKVVQLQGNRPRRGGLRSGYLDHLEELLMKREGQKPSLTDASIWFYRATDLERKLRKQHTDGQQLLDSMRIAFRRDLGLTQAEVSKLFDDDMQITLAGSLAEMVQSEPADPRTYLPLPSAEHHRSSEDISEMAAAFRADATDESTCLHLPHGISARLIAAMLSKKFTILTGLAGSGKTKLAQAFATWLADRAQAAAVQVGLVPVGADWTNREPLLGYPDALSAGEYRLPASGALQLMMRAEKDPERPYFLILDEMNLSHVERYFADVLSAMESGQLITLHEERTYPGKDWNGVPHEINLPSNLFVIGTVNVDETTYMFSPKVLDRANVIEFTVTRGEISAFLDNPAPVDLSQLAGKGAAYAEAFVTEAGRKDIPLDEFGRTLKDSVKQMVEELFAALAPVGAEFGYRPAYEIFRFIYFHAKVAGDGWKLDDALDAAIMQKLLPKLHGSKTKLGPVLAELKKICTTGKYPLSAAKIERMELRLKQNGFTSYAEA